METTERFGDRVADYVKYRPSYPGEVVRILEREAGISPTEGRIADVGSGTGISSLLFLREGYEVVGVEPNAPMRDESVRLLAEYKQFSAVDGTAEKTTLSDSSCQMVLAAQAFHWFEQIGARQEFRRILQANGVVALVWNERREDTPFLRAYEDALVRFGTDYTKVKHQNIDETQIRAFYEGPVEMRVVPSHQDFDLDGLLGRARSSSYVPKSGDKHAALMKLLREIFEAHEENGVVRFSYDTRLWFSPLPPSPKEAMKLP